MVVGDFTSKLVVWGLCCPICASRSHGNVLAAPLEQDQDDVDQEMIQDQLLTAIHSIFILNIVTKSIIGSTILKEILIGCQFIASVFC